MIFRKINRELLNFIVNIFYLIVFYYKKVKFFNFTYIVKAIKINL